MAVDFSLLPPEQDIPKDPPSRLVWTIVFFLLTLAGVFVVLLLWPKDEPTQTSWFWVCIALYPAGTSAFVVSRRYSVYEGHRLDVHAWNEERKRYIEDLFDRASIPFAVIGAAFSFIDDEKLDNVSAIAERTLVLKAQPAIAEQGTVSARWFAPDALERKAWLRGPDTVRQAQVLVWVFDRLLYRSRNALAKLPDNLPLVVRIKVVANAYEGDWGSLWNERWRQLSLPPSTVVIEPEDMGLMDVDSWLDSSDSRLQTHATLVVVVQLNEILGKNPPEGSAETCAAVLLVPERLLQHHRLEPIARIHRPMTGSKDSLTHVLRYALRWGKADPLSIGRSWLNNLNAASTSVFHAALREVGVTSARDTPLPELNLDRTVGHAGSAADWLALACAAASSQQLGSPQLVVMQHASDIVSTVVAAP
ncbi:hypothetical protein [Paraburkholderia sp. HD33-4]|uniref:hypothetical protein n=1 Tax=Paraburkholderia sp. HD33-4 TaxID=2883242 RepID=UPI001F168D53|nr:hypothetical protein [Paraburkholderia sp. HD33-4]